MGGSSSKAKEAKEKEKEKEKEKGAKEKGAASQQQHCVISYLILSRPSPVRYLPSPGRTRLRWAAPCDAVSASW